MKTFVVRFEGVKNYHQGQLYHSGLDFLSNCFPKVGGIKWEFNNDFHFSRLIKYLTVPGMQHSMCSRLHK